MVLDSIKLKYYILILILICTHSWYFHDTSCSFFFMHDFHLILLIYLLSVNMETFFLVIVRNIASADNSWRGRAVVLHVELHLSILFQILLPSRVFGVRKLWQLPFCRNWWAALWITFFWQLGFNTKCLVLHQCLNCIVYQVEKYFMSTLIMYFVAMLIQCLINFDRCNSFGV